MSTGQFHKLLSPLSLGSGLTLKNRMIKAPQSSWFFEDDGSAGDRVIDFYEAIAAGGVGLVIVSAITWRSDHPAGAYGALHDDRFLPGMKRLVERCHAHGCPVFCQLHLLSLDASALLVLKISYWLLFLFLSGPYISANQHDQCDHCDDKWS